MGSVPRRLPCTRFDAEPASIATPLPPLLPITLPAPGLPIVLSDCAFQPHAVAGVRIVDDRVRSRGRR